MERFLAKALARKIPGVGEKTASRIVEAVGGDLGRCTPEKLFSLGVRNPERVWGEIERNLAEIEEEALFRKLGFNLRQWTEIKRVFGGEAASVASTQAYSLVRKVRGIGFLTADKAALAAGIPRNHPERIAEGIHHVLATALYEGGHTRLLWETVERKTAELLRVERREVARRIPDLLTEGRIVLRTVRGKDWILLPEADRAEETVARKLLRLVCPPDPAAAIAGWKGPRLDREQKRAIHVLCSLSPSILAGPPGSGKTTTINALAHGFHRVGEKVLLCAPTGRAAARITETSGLRALTIHRAAGITKEGAVRGRIAADAVIVDESSMVDVFTFAKLLKAIRRPLRLVLSGDPDQLPPVGPGQPFKDLTRAGVPTARLRKIHRQAEGSRILEAAAEVIQGRLSLPRPGRGTLHEAAFLPCPEEKIRDVLLRAVNNYFPRFGIRPRDVQVLTPVNDGPAGRRELNRILKAALNPGRRLSPGDKVVHTTNDYELELFNGEIGVVVDSFPEGVVVDFGGTLKKIPREKSDQLEPAWALTVHKAQGGEFPGVLLVLTKKAWFLLSRNLIYTAVTRAKKALLIIGDPEALDKAVSTPEKWRGTLLVERLRELKN